MQPVFVTNLKTEKELDLEYKRRCKSNITEEMSVDVSDYDKLCAKYGANNVKLVKSRNIYKCTIPKEPWKIFEDKVWCVLYKLGFEEMNGDNCYIMRDSNSSIEKQVDIFAKKDNIVCVIECKSTEKSKRSIKDPIDAFAAVRTDSLKYIYSNYPDEKIEDLWILATNSRQLENKTIEHARMQRIRLVNNWDYYEELALTLGNAALYQFLANMFDRREISGLSPKVSALRGNMGKFTYYQFSINPADLMKIAFVPHTAIKDRDNIEMYQRLVKPARIKKISDYISNNGGVFPTNIVINLYSNGKKINFDLKGKKENGVTPGILHLPNSFGSAYIIDGQHRLFSYAGLDQAYSELLPVIAFDNISPEDQSELFIKINGEQEKVSKNLLNQIVCRQNWNSDLDKNRFYALPYVVILELNNNPTSPFSGKIKMEGDKQSGIVTMTYAELTDKLKSLNIFGTSNRRSKFIDRDLLFFNDFESTFLQGYHVISSYFEYLIAHSERFNREWNSESNNYLSTNGSVVPLFGVLKYILLYISNVKSIRDRSYKEYINDIYDLEEPICEFFDGFNEETYLDYKLGTGKKGYSMREDILIEVINKTHPDFMCERIKEIKDKRNKEFQSNHVVNTPAMSLIETLQKQLQFITKNELCKSFGSLWLTTNVPDDVRNSAFANASARGVYDDIIRGCVFIDVKRITEFKNNSDVLMPLFDLSDNPNLKKSSRLSWMAQINKIRNNVAHGWGIGETEFKYLTDTCSKMNEKFQKYIECSGLEEDWEQFYEYVLPDIID